MGETADRVGRSLDQSSSAKVNQDERNKTIAEEAKKTAERDARDRDLASAFIFSSPTVLEYPKRVGDDEHQPHSVRFFINARSNSRVA